MAEHMNAELHVVLVPAAIKQYNAHTLNTHCIYTYSNTLAFLRQLTLPIESRTYKPRSHPKSRIVSKNLR